MRMGCPPHANKPKHRTVHHKEWHVASRRLLAYVRGVVHLSQEEANHIALCPRCRDAFDVVALGRMWLRINHPIHQQHAEFISESLLCDWMNGTLCGKTDRQISKMTRTCPICRSLAIHAGHDLTALGIHVDWSRIQGHVDVTEDND